MAYQPDTFEPLARAIGWLLSGDVPGLYRWNDYTYDEDLIGYRTGDQDRLLFQRSRNDKGWMELSKIRPRELVNLVYHEPTVLRTRQIDASSIVIKNFDGAIPQPFTYKVPLGDTTSESEAIHASATASSKTTFGTGDGLPVKGEQEFTLAVTSGWEKQGTKGSTAVREFSESGDVPPGYDLRFFATRSIQDLRRLITGFGTFDCAILIGKRYRRKGRSTHIWRGAEYWSSVDDLIAVVERRSPLNWDLAGHFASNQVPAERLAMVKKPPRSPYEQWYEYNDVTAIELVQEVIRKKHVDADDDDDDDALTA